MKLSISQELFWQVFSLSTAFVIWILALRAQNLVNKKRSNSELTCYFLRFLLGYHKRDCCEKNEG